VITDVPAELIVNIFPDTVATEVLLLSDWLKQKYRLIDFTGTTNEQAIKKILTFYKHKTIRRGVGDHIFFEGFDMIDGKARISLGS
jgi:hypothetical protein